MDGRYSTVLARTLSEYGLDIVCGARAKDVLRKIKGVWWDARAKECAPVACDAFTYVVFWTAKVARRVATRRAFLSHVEQNLLVHHGVCVVVRPARFAGVNVPARHHVWGVHACCRSRVHNLKEVANYEIWSARDLRHDPTAVVQLVGFHPNACIS